MPRTINEYIASLPEESIQKIMDMVLEEKARLFAAELEVLLNKYKLTVWVSIFETLEVSDSTDGYTVRVRANTNLQNSVEIAINEE